MRSNASKDSSRGLQVSSEINFLISVRKILPTSGQTVDLTKKIVWELNAPFGFGKKEKKRRVQSTRHAQTFILFLLKKPFMACSQFEWGAL